MIASRVVVVSEVVAELAFRMKLPGIHDIDNLLVCMCVCVCVRACVCACVCVCVCV